MIEVYGDRRSGNCLKVVWLLEALGRPYRWHEVDVLAGDTRTAAFAELNGARQIPVVKLEDGRTLAQSNAILLHLAEGGALVPSDPFDRAVMFQWLFWEQYSHEPFIAVRRFQRVYLGRTDSELDVQLLEKGYAALEIMEARLRNHLWLAGDGVSVADLALLPYTALAPEGGFDLGRYPSVSAWIDRTREAFHVEAFPLASHMIDRPVPASRAQPLSGYSEDAAAAFCAEWLPAWTGGDARRLAAFYTDDAVYADPARPLGVAGKEALTTYFERLLGRFPDWVWTHNRSLPVPDGFLNFWTCSMTGPERSVSGVCVVQLRDGLIYRNEVFFDPAVLTNPGRA